MKQERINAECGWEELFLLYINTQWLLFQDWESDRKGTEKWVKTAVDMGSKKSEVI